MIVDLATAAAAARRARAEGRPVALANGAFDLLHVGHLRYLQGARAAVGAGGLLVVGVNTDASVRLAKGPARPVVGEQERAELVDGLRAVDLVVLFGGQRVDALLVALRPDLHVKGTDYTAESVPEAALVRSLGGRTVIAGDPKEHSTTDVLARLRDADAGARDVVGAPEAPPPWGPAGGPGRPGR